MSSNSGEISENLIVITYNVQQLISSYYPQERAKQLIKYLLDKNKETQGIDVFILEEAFLPCFLGKLKKSSLAESYHIIEPKGVSLINSGVCILLKKDKFKEFKVTKKNYSFATSVDQLVPKGFTHVQVGNKDEATSHIIGTHTQAQYTGSDHQIIATFAQIAELGQYLAKIPKADRIILAGDLNIFKTETKPTIDCKFLKYLIYPLSVHVTQGNSYDPQKNHLAKKTDPNGSAGTLDYVISYGYGNNEGEILFDTEYEQNSKDISDHYPIRCAVKPVEIKIEEEQQQKIILAKLLRAAFQETTQTHLLGCWKVSHAKKIYFSIARLIAHYESLTPEARAALGYGSDFLNYCLNYNEATAFTSFCEPSEQDKKNIQSLAQLIDYRPFKPSSSDLTMEIFEQDNIFDKIKTLLETTRRIVNDPKWNRRGRNCFYMSSKCPDGIKRMRYYLKKLDDGGDAGIDLLEHFYFIRGLAFGKATDAFRHINTPFRGDETQEVYEKILDVYDGFSLLFESALDGKRKCDENFDSLLSDLEAPSEAKLSLNTDRNLTF